MFQNFYASKVQPRQPLTIWSTSMALVGNQPIFTLKLKYIHYTDFSTDECIEEFIKRKWSSGLFWVGSELQRKNLSTAISKQLFEVVF